MLCVNGDIVQFCWVVPDLDQAVKAWVEVRGAGPFFVDKNIAGLKVEYRGTPAALNIGIALGQAGKVQIELVQRNSEQPDVYSELYPDRSRGGFHHVALFVPDIERALAEFRAAGHELAMRGPFLDSVFAYVDTRSATGGYTELYQEAPGMRGLYRKVAQAAAGWDRSRPVRPLAEVLG